MQNKWIRDKISRFLPHTTMMPCEKTKLDVTKDRPVETWKADKLVLSEMEVNRAVLLFCRVLGPGPSCSPRLFLHPGAAVGHRGGGDGHHASGLLPQHAGRLAGGDPGDVWWAQDQREGAPELKKEHLNRSESINGHILRVHLNLVLPAICRCRNIKSNRKHLATLWF